ncbi:hypothetical protein QE152_g22764 [Popillia japonica]|uniref:Uncharacterized protein n=1 Tax=Popillia japonica TaxID=7064 RepID=A0AAW1KKN6_POPJA
MWDCFCDQGRYSNDNDCCPDWCENNKVKGRFGVAFVAETPCCCPEPIGWQIEFCDTPSKVEQRCREMIEWANCPPLPRCRPCPPVEVQSPCFPPKCNPCWPKTNRCTPPPCCACCQNNGSSKLARKGCCCSSGGNYNEKGMGKGMGMVFRSRETVGNKEWEWCFVQGKRWEM